MNSNRIIISIIATLLTGAVASMALNACQKRLKKEKQARDAVTENPFYDEFRSAGVRQGLNMDFTRHATCAGMTQLKLERIPLLSSEPGSCDVLLVGDSSMAWGMIPEVIEQMTGLTVGVFASEALILNVTVARLIDNLASYYLKKDGLLILSFGGWTQEQGAHSMVLVYAEWIYGAANMNNAEFAAYMEKWRSERAAGEYAGGLLDRLGFSSYRKSIKKLKSSLADELGLSLFQVSLYNDYIEPYINPRWHKQKMEMKSKIKCYLRWNDRSIVMHTADQGKRSIHSETPADPAYANADIAIVSSMLKRIPFRKAYQIHINFDDSKYARLRSIYNAYYRDSFNLIDLGREHPKNESYEVDEKEHTINAGGFYQSILIGGFLKKNYTSLGRSRPAPAMK
ncbi:MAG: hypothetical protein JXA07_06355 [Spirochaetes bacterium]|nr:hypothetical protein [Spirochaetota bacterium]